LRPVVGAVVVWNQELCIAIIAVDIIYGSRTELVVAVPTRASGREVM
jgi:hypothetical protein